MYKFKERVCEIIMANIGWYSKSNYKEIAEIDISKIQNQILALVKERDKKIMENIRMLYIQNDTPMIFVDKLYQLFSDKGD